MSSLAAHFLDDNGADRIDGTLVTYNPIVSGALPTVTLSSGTGAQISATRDTRVGLLYTLDATNNVATVKLELSPDNSTYTSLGTISFAAAVNNTGAIAELLTFGVPAGWYVKVTVVHAAITSTTYYQTVANPYPAVFRDDNSDTRLAGAIDFTDSGNQPATPFSGASFTRATSQTAIPVNTPTLVSWTTLTYDTSGYATLPATAVTIPVTAYYLVIANLRVIDDAGVDGVMYAVIQDGAGATLRQVESFYQGANGEDVLGVSDVMLLAASSQLRVEATWASGDVGATTFEVHSGAATHFTVTRLGTP